MQSKETGVQYGLKLRREEVNLMEKLTNELLSELNCNTAFTIPIGGGIAVPESVVLTWGIMAALIFGSYLLTKNLSVEQPGRVQLLLESAYQTAADFFGELLGENGLRYIPYLLSVLVYIAAANLIGILGMKPSTKDLGVTAGLAILSIYKTVVAVHASVWKCPWSICSHGNFKTGSSYFSAGSLQCIF